LSGYASFITSPLAGRWRGACAVTEGATGWSDAVRAPVVWRRRRPLHHSVVPLPTFGGEVMEARLFPSSRARQRIRRGGRRMGRGARNRMRPAFALRALCDFRHLTCAPPRSVHASAWGDCLFSRGSGTRMLVRPTSPVPVRQQVPVSRPATGEASRNAPDPGVSPRAVPLDRPPPPRQCLGPEAPLLRRRRREGCTGRDLVGKNGARNDGGVERVREFGGRFRI